MRFNIHAFHASTNRFYFDFGSCCETIARAEIGVTIANMANVNQVISAVKKTNGAFEARINGGSAFLSSAIMTDTLPIDVSSTLYIGGATVAEAYFNGYISEVIVFNRALKTEERQAVEQYLGKKWGIRIS